MINGNGDSAYGQPAFPTADTALTSILLAFGFSLLRAPEPMCHWTWEFASKEDFLRWKGGDKSVRIVEKCTWNIAMIPGKSLQQAGAIVNAYQRSDAMAQLDAELEGIEPVKIERIKNAVQSLLVEMGREVLEQHKFLIRQLKARPKDALWIEVHNPRDKACVSIFGANASNKTIEDHLNIHV